MLKLALNYMEASGSRMKKCEKVQSILSKETVHNEDTTSQLIKEKLGEQKPA